MADEQVLTVDVFRRDFYNHECAICDSGSYKASDQLATEVRCSSCGDVIPRYLTKREFLHHQLGLGDKV